MSRVLDVDKCADLKVPCQAITISARSQPCLDKLPDSSAQLRAQNWHEAAPKERAGNLCANLGCGPVRAYEPKADPGPVRLGSQISGVANPDLQR